MGKSSILPSSELIRNGEELGLLQRNAQISMSLQFKTRLAASLLAAAFSVAGAQPAQPRHAGPGERWAATWIAPAQPLWSPDFALPLGMPASLENTTIRQSLRVSLGGERIRLVVDNRYGSEPLKVGRVQVA